MNKIGKFFLKFIIGVGNWFKGIGIAIYKFFRNFPKNFVNFFARYAHIFSEGDIWVKTSFIVMGSGAIARKQIGKGLTYLFLELLFVFYMLFNGAGAIAQFFTLGTSFSYSITYMNTGSAVTIPGDNSMLALLYGVVAWIVIAAFLIIYFMNIKSAFESYENSVIGKKLPSFKDDMRELFDNKFYVLLLFVALAGVIVFTVLPLIFMILIAFTNYDKAHDPTKGFDWIGLKNFGALVGTTGMSKTFFPVLGWTLLWALAATFLNYFLGVGLALLINKKEIKGKKVWRLLFVLTIAIPQFVSLLLMRQLLGSYGPISEMFAGGKLHLLDNDANVWVARITVIVINLWVGIPYSMLITSGILMNIPADLYESARIDGAGKMTMFRKITMPYIMFIMGPYLITQFIGNINNFNVIYLLTGGAPYVGLDSGGTDLLVTWLYKITLNESNYKLASTIGIVTFIVCSIISLITYRSSSATKNEGDFS